MAMEKLHKYLNEQKGESRIAFLNACGTSENYIRKMISIRARFGAEMCTRIEQASKGAVTRKDLRPNDWAKIWPELAQEATASSKVAGTNGKVGA